jgi:hypothetical protein
MTEFNHNLDPEKNDHAIHCLSDYTESLKNINSQGNIKKPSWFDDDYTAIKPLRLIPRFNDHNFSYAFEEAIFGHLRRDKPPPEVELLTEIQLQELREIWTPFDDKEFPIWMKRWGFLVKTKDENTLKYHYKKDIIYAQIREKIDRDKIREEERRERVRLEIMVKEKEERRLTGKRRPYMISEIRAREIADEKEKSKILSMEKQLFKDATQPRSHIKKFSKKRKKRKK